MAVVVNEALSQLGKETSPMIVGSPRKFKDYGVEKNMTLMVNDEILVEGQVPRLDKVIEKLKPYL